LITASQTGGINCHKTTRIDTPHDQNHIHPDHEQATQQKYSQSSQGSHLQASVLVQAKSAGRE